MKNRVAVAALLGSLLAAAPAVAAAPGSPPLAAGWRRDRFSVGWGVAVFAETYDWVAELLMRFSWSPLPWVGVTGDFSVFNDVAAFMPLAVSARVGPTLRPWSLEQAPVAPYVTAQVGLVQPIPWVSPDRADGIARVEAGIDIRLGAALFMSIGGGLMSAGSDSSNTVRFFQLVFAFRR